MTQYLKKKKKSEHGDEWQTALSVQCIVGHQPTCQLLPLLQIPLIPDINSAQRSVDRDKELSRVVYTVLTEATDNLREWIHKYMNV